MDWSAMSGLLSIAVESEHRGDSIAFGFLWFFSLILMVSTIRGEHLTVALQAFRFQVSFTITLWDRPEA